MDRVLFRVEGGAEVGFGHLRRSLSLAMGLKKEGTESLFLTSPKVKEAGIVERFGFSAEVPLNEGAGWETQGMEATGEAARRWRASAIVVDAPGATAQYVAGLRAGGFFVLVRDDLGETDFPADVVLNGNADAPELPYPKRGGTAQPHYLLGVRYAVLPEEFWEGVPRRRVGSGVQRVLLTLGGADPDDRLPGLLECIDALPGGFSVAVVLGPFFVQGDGVRMESRGRYRHAVEWITQADSLAPWMMQADVAVSGAGQTLYELACAGCPTVAVSVAENQRGQLRALEKAGCLTDAGTLSHPSTLLHVRQRLERLLIDSRVRSEMARRGQQFVDGKGVSRVIRQIRSLSPSSVCR